MENFLFPRGYFKIPTWGFFRPNADGTNSSHKYGTTLPDYLPYYIRSLVDTSNPRRAAMIRVALCRGGPMCPPVVSKVTALWL